MVPKVLQITENEVCWEENTFPHAWSPRKFVYCCAFNHSFAQNIIFLTNIIFIQGAFKNIQGLLWKIQGIFKDIAQFFIFQGLFIVFKDMMLFQGLFQGLCEPCYRVRNRAVTKGQALGISPGYYEHDHRLFSCFLMSSKQFYTFKDFSIRQNTDRLKQKFTAYQACRKADLNLIGCGN